MDAYQKQLDTRALEIASQANARVDGLEKLLTVSIDGMKGQMAENREVRDRQHAFAERQFDRIARWQMGLAVGTILLLLPIIGFFISQKFH